MSKKNPGKWYPGEVFEGRNPPKGQWCLLNKDETDVNKRRWRKVR